jgi:hypothetical protein
MGRPGFILQHVVDAIGAQTATREARPIRVVFSPAGLYLHVEQEFSGRQVQRVMTGSTISLPLFAFRMVIILFASPTDH